MIRRRLIAIIDPGVRRLHSDAELGWRMFRMQTRRIGRLINARNDDRNRIAALETNLLKAVEDRFKMNTALTAASDEIDQLRKELAAARRAHDDDERRATRYRAAWLICRQTRSQIRAEVEKQSGKEPQRWPATVTAKSTM